LHQEGSRLFATAGLTRHDIAEDTTAGAEDTTAGLSDDTDTVPDTQNNQLVLSQANAGGMSTNVLTASKVKGIQRLVATVRKRETADTLGNMRHRWDMSTLYAEYERLECLLRSRINLKSTQGRGVATVAREQLFAEISGVTLRTWNR